MTRRARFRRADRPRRASWSVEQPSLTVAPTPGAARSLHFWPGPPAKFYPHHFLVPAPISRDGGRHRHGRPPGRHRQDGLDAGVRFAESVPGDMIAVPLGPEQRLIVVAS